ncbi:polysaccharide deacetylase family protein [Microcoleus sp. LEGE 07076]|uniref:polysaccharide deacetylase family protein n=1 Tax=Microcoleus sp. LEGE 07076 TaxID=915322 RepID=UPI00187F500A|nr:polysaccharide deacetylase family protein [Microcoleus sp. LEGE 07076]MBE9186092.1 polysaccharide deacetylase family protein [Microcoleus sp. LEGE 07076]
MRIGKKLQKFLLLTVAFFFAATLLINVTNFHNYFGINRADTAVKVVALSYDDGPYPPYTNQLLDVLDRYQVKATFFEIGRNIEKHPEIVKTIAARGNELANHSYSHKDMMFKPREYLLSEIAKTDKLLLELGVKQESISFRPPWGRRFVVLSYLVSQMHKKLIMWDVDSHDYEKKLTVEDIANRVIDNVRSGSIVVMHDGGGDRSKTVAATEIIVKNLRSKGYEFKTVSELLK